MKIIDLIKTHVDDINGYKQQAFSWKLKNDGKPYKAIADVLKNGGPMAEAIKAIPEQLDREAVAKCFRADLYRGFVATLLWGGMHKDINLMRHFMELAQDDKNVIVEKLGRVKKMLEKDMPGEALASMMRGVYIDKVKENHINGISISYATKLIYFLSDGLKMSVRPLIYDKFLANSHCALLTDWKKHVPYFVYDEKAKALKCTINLMAHTSEIYTHYCNLMAEVAKECGIKKVDNLEAWLFGWPMSKNGGNEDNPRYVSMIQAAECCRKYNKSL